MPLTKEGKKTKRSFQKEYGKEKGEDIFYAYMNKNKRKKGVQKLHTKRKMNDDDNRPLFDNFTTNE